MKKMLVCLILCMVSCGCQKTYYKTMEVFGKQKRDILVDRVEKARDSQEDAKEQFQTALEKFSAVTNFKGGKLEEKYNQLNSELQRSDSKAQAVRERIAAVDDVSNALFKEWQTEIGQYQNDKMRRASKEQLELTRQRYSELIRAMKKAETKMAPVLSAFRDQVLFLKHNLNAQAIASLQTEFASIETDINSLIKEMEVSIAEADSFIKEMGTLK